MNDAVGDIVDFLAIIAVAAVDFTLMLPLMLPLPQLLPLPLMLPSLLPLMLPFGLQSAQTVTATTTVGIEI